MLQTDKTHFWQSVEVLLSKYDKILLKFCKKLVNKFLFKKIPQYFHLDTATHFW